MATTSTSRRTALLFPGQGSHTAGMSGVVTEYCPELLTLARRELGADPFERLEESTYFAQPAIYCASIAFWERAGRPRGDAVAGHSLGELAALVAGGALSVEDGLRLAVIRGRLMEEVAAANPGGMLAVLGEGDVAPVAASFGLVVANDNAPGQVVLSGPDEGLREARRRLRELGLKAIRLPVAGAFHSPSMAAAATRFRRALGAVEFHLPEVPVFSSTAAQPFDDPREGLAAALTDPVRWRLTLKHLCDAGISRFVEAGPGEVLIGLVRRTLGAETEVSALSATEAVGA